MTPPRRRRRVHEPFRGEGPQPFRLRVSFALDPSIWRRFRAACRAKGLSASQMLRRLVLLALGEAYDPLYYPPKEEPGDP